MLINPTPLQHWMDNFYGYGSWKAPCWFISHEDGGGELPEEVAEKINYYYEHHPIAEPTLCDIRDLYANANLYGEGQKGKQYDTLHDYRFGAKAAPNNVWKNLIAFVHAFNNQPLPDDLLGYQRTQFASSTATEALIKLFPLPGPRHHGWPYSWLEMPAMPFLKSRTLYEQHLYPQRIGIILQQIKQYQPKLVLMYGMNSINELKKSIAGFFPGVAFTSIKAVRQQIPQHHRAELSGTTLLLTTQIPALRHNRVETGFDWFAFGRSVRETV